MRKLLWLLLLPPLLLILLYGASPYVARSVLEQWLREQGFSDPSVQLAHPAWDRLEIDHLNLTQAGPERRIELRAERVSLHYDPLRLLLEREIAELRIPHLALRIDANASLEQRIEQVDMHRFDLSLALPALLFQYAPSRRLVIGQVELDYQAPQQPRFTVSGNLDLTRSLLLSRLAIDLAPADAPSDIPSTPLYLDLQFTREQALTLNLVRMQQTLLQAQGQLDTEPERWRLKLASQLQPTELQHWLAPLLPATVPTLKSTGLALDLTLDWPTRLPLQADALLPSLNLELTARGALLPPKAWIPPPLSLIGAGLETRLNARLQQGQADFSVQLPRLALQLNGRDLPPAAVHLSGQWTVPASPLAGRLQLQTATPALELQSDWQVVPEGLNAHWHLTPVPLRTLPELLRPILPGLGLSYPSELKLSDGRLRLSGDLALRGSALSQQVQAKLENAALAWQEAAQLRDLQASLDARLTPDGSLTAKGRLDARRIDAGLPLQLAPLDYRYDRRADGREVLYLSASRLDLLGGRISLPPLALNPRHPRLNTVATLEQIELAEILNLYQQPGLSGAIRLRGELPLQIDGTDLRVQQGWLQNEGPGWLRYQPDAGMAQSAAQNPGLQLALSALSNLQIEQLHLLADYAPNGDLELVSRFQGHNPDWQQGRPIDLTLNLEENLLMLLRSLQLSSRIGDSVNRRLNR